jgi:hypothetical protein
VVEGLGAGVWRRVWVLCDGFSGMIYTLTAIKKHTKPVRFLTGFHCSDSIGGIDREGD